ncbi:hypothetical protein [Jeotgalibaca caeni]|uniref:hypothetical protein n=1 Tax=Jeotgalibaca caeni TaxID=3028623 RepID=UPI00237EB5C2|nr:hypothetical protein [Jeotgalibaca caeni]MDE1548155.1 hypothetical protein [Jeotgalibaca caeni]
MDLQVLVATMNQKDDALIERMNLQSDAIIINQTDTHNYEKVERNGKTIEIYSFAERGVGLSRNSALMRASAAHALLADDDMVYVDGYPKLVEEQFKKYPDADVLIFNLEEEIPTRYIIRQPFQVSKRNYMRFGAARIAFRPESIHKKGIFFHLQFGGGTPHSNGEDTIFLRDCLEKRLKIMAVPVTIAKLTEERESTWFKGYNEKYYRDRGALFKTLSPKLYHLLILQFVVRKYQPNQGMPSRQEQIRYMMEGAKEM